MNAQQAGRQVERELLILLRHMNMTRPRGPRKQAVLDRSAYVLLTRIEAEGRPMSIPDLVEAFGLAPSTLNRQTAALLKNGLVERTVDPNGSIAHKFRITEEGFTRLTAERDISASGLAEVLQGWTPERLERFIDDLEQFNTDIERLTGRPWPRANRTTN
ncbi:MarR family winged helix-turn-helix transcriptional regulator [Streptomyces sp. NPDC048251]|uniref:MarR family winged helix-turn-helix transcriptional regulator n=1 Tax=Streptomyces sp. NPDC048251 TaxID=3154501 RepID=UPI00341379F0